MGKTLEVFAPRYPDSSGERVVITTNYATAQALADLIEEGRRGSVIGKYKGLTYLLLLRDEINGAFQKLRSDALGADKAARRAAEIRELHLSLGDEHSKLTEKYGHDVVYRYGRAGKEHKWP